MNLYDMTKRLWDYLINKTICPEGFWKKFIVNLYT